MRDRPVTRAPPAIVFVTLAPPLFYISSMSPAKLSIVPRTRVVGGCCAEACPPNRRATARLISNTSRDIINLVRLAHPNGAFRYVNTPARPKFRRLRSLHRRSQSIAPDRDAAELQRTVGFRCN